MRQQLEDAASRTELEQLREHGRWVDEQVSYLYKQQELLGEKQSKLKVRCQ